VGTDLVSLLAPGRKGKAPVPYSSAQAGGGPLTSWLGGGRSRKDDLDAMGSVGTLYGIIRRLAEAVSKVQWHIHDDAPGGKCEICGEEGVTLNTDVEHPALALWNLPNQHWHGSLFRQEFTQHKDLTGEAYWFVVKILGVPVELWPIPPDRMTPAKHPRDYLVGWWYTDPDGDKIPLPVDEVIQLRTPDPSDSYRGLGPLGALAPDLGAARAAAEWNARFFENSALPSGVIEYEERLNDDEFKELTERWRAMHQGVGNSHRVAIVEGGKWVDRKFSNRDMEFTSLRTLSGDLIREAFGFPKFAQGIVEDVNRASAEASDDFFAAWLAVPRLNDIRDVLNTRLVPMFGTMMRGQSFAYRSPVEGDIETAAKVFGLKATGFATLVAAGVDGTAALEAAGLPAMEWKRIEPKAPVAGQPGGRGLPPAPARDEPAEDRTPVLAELVRGWDGHQVIEGEVLPEISAALEQVQDDWSRSLEVLLAEWSREVTRSQRRALEDAVRAAMDSGDPYRLAVLDVGVDVSQAAAMLDAAMTALALQAGVRMSAEAAAQGVEVAAGSVAGDEFTAVAAATASLLLTGVAVAAGMEALRWVGSGRTAASVADTVGDFMREMSDARLRTALGGALTRAQNAGRWATLQGAPAARYYATEVLDGSTCKPCKNIDGKRLPTLDAVLLAYGGGGGYLFCEGRDRCRGTFVAFWSNGDN
jgi:HK97 family phage portal protein